MTALATDTVPAGTSACLNEMTGVDEDACFKNVGSKVLKLK